MRILHVVQDLAAETGGLAVSASGLAEAQAAGGHRVGLVAAETGRPRMPEPAGVAVRVFPCRVRAWRYAPALAGFLARTVPDHDIVHVHGLWQYPTLAAARACRAAGVPYAVSPRGMLDAWSMGHRGWKKRPYLRLVEAHTLRAARGLHATSPAEVVASGMTRWNPRVFVLPNGLGAATTRLPASDAFRARFPAVGDRRIVLFLGRLHPKKQPAVLLRAFARLAPQAPDLQLVLAGPGDPPMVQGLADLAGELGVGDRTLLTGPLAGAAVQEAYRAAAVFVLPSLQENFGNTVAEAMAAACPVVVSDRVALAAEVRAAEAGLVTPPTVEDTAAAIEAVLQDEPRRRAMGEHGRRFVLAHLTWEGIAADYGVVYGDMIAGRRTSPAWWPTC